MEIWKRLMKIFILLSILALIQLSCSSPFLKTKEPQSLTIDEGIPDVDVKELGEDPNLNKVEGGALPVVALASPVPQPNPVASPAIVEKPTKKTKGKDTKTKGSVAVAGKNDLPEGSQRGLKSESSKPREPKHESNIGFTGGGRRPDKDPFRVGEKVTLSVRYFKAEAGEMTLEVRPMVEVDGRKAYRWHTSLKTTGMFSRFYSVEDWAETLVDYETLMPSVYNLNVKESAQLRNAKGYFNAKTMKGVYIEKKFTEKKGHQEKRQEWQIQPYAQNVFSAAFYMRVFSYEVGKEYKFTVADDEKNMLFRGKALRKERIETEAGFFDTIVVKPEFEIDGVFRPVGDIFFWLTDDDRKMIVRIESEIKIGTLVMEAIQVDPGST
ncbi:MAG: hypothetical protein RJB66_2101 [Pseudomonadota bacterium]